MPSLRARLLPAVLRLRGSKRIFRSQQRTLDYAARLHRRPETSMPPRWLSRTVDASAHPHAPFPVWRLTPPGAAPDRHVVFLHGGFYVFDIDPLHWRLAARLAVEAGVTVTVPLFRRAPDVTASVTVPAVADLVASLGPDVSVVGDSAGGGMALAVAMLLRDRALSPLQATVLISPWLDISRTDPALAEIDPVDPWLAVPAALALGDLYRGELSVNDPLVSPIHGSFDGLGAITLFSGTRDILNADAHRLVARAGSQVTFHEAPGMVHNYPIMPMPEGDAARAIIVKALR